VRARLGGLREPPATANEGGKLILLLYSRRHLWDLTRRFTFASFLFGYSKPGPFHIFGLSVAFERSSMLGRIVTFAPTAPSDRARAHVG
jgi:hypothetical protein